jgi:subtilisin family serine protease
MASGAAGGVSSSTNYFEGEVLVTCSAPTNLEAVREALQRHSLGIAHHFAFLSQHLGKQVCLVRGTNWSTAALVAELEGEPWVETVEPNYYRWALGSHVPNDPLFSQLWGLENNGQPVQGSLGGKGADIKFVEAWSFARPNTNSVVVAVVDSGVDYSHPDLAANMWVNAKEQAGNSLDDDHNGYVDDYYGYNFAIDDNDPTDSGAHGTHIAGTIAAVGNNDLGVAGVNYRAKIMALRVSQDGHSFLSSAIVDAVQYATLMKQRGINVVAINASYGGVYSSTAERLSIQAAGDAGIVFCAAAGNDTNSNDIVSMYPANYRLTNMIVVAATDQTDALATFSNYGASSVDLAAPGVNILSTTPPGMTSYVQVASITYGAEALEYAGETRGLVGSIHDCGLGYPTNFDASVSGNIALIARGTLYFYEKVANAAAAGAVGAIIYNNTDGSFAGTLGTAGSWIPAVTISRLDGLALKASLPGIGRLFSAIDTNAIYHYLDGTSMAAPHVAGAVAFAAMNFPEETVIQRVQRILKNVDPVPALAGKVTTGGRLNLLRTVDTNSNKMPDWWETQYFSLATPADPDADPDKDGVSNVREYISDTNPLDGTSDVHFTGVERTPAGTRLTWTGGTAARQYLQRTSSISAAASWQEVWTNEPPTTVAASFLDVSATNHGCFYRLLLERP